MLRNQDYYFVALFTRWPLKEEKSNDYSSGASCSDGG